MAQATTVKLSRDMRELLEKLRAEIMLKYGERLSVQSLLEAAIRLAWRRREELARELGAWKPLSREDAEKLLDEAETDLGVTETVDDIDRVVYGEAP